MSTSKILKWVTGGLEAFLGIPILGGFVVLAFSYVPLVIMLALHIITLIVSNKERTNKLPSIVGIITSCLAWIPFLGMVLHIISAIFLVIDALGKDRESTNRPWS
ncbi:hypothetical protein [Paenibacillus eucommiae]|uniref:Branched-subunit amino acid permease n=1 Tax=Paenibacillus eucommiae TaxID=1355755 RepID=A0ABS4IZW2_9BACL|nr:hypothetical protein [Paenibacillus eucommiae]MBP1993096.1 putative branched-subunit amino acid permease [Paenibacillus eucommiae]